MLLEYYIKVSQLEFFTQYLKVLAYLILILIIFAILTILILKVEDAL